MAIDGNANKRLIVLDTNVLMHDPSCLFRFKEHDIFLPMMVLEELDNNKRGHSEVARNARQASRFLEERIRNVSREAIEQGLALPPLGDNGSGGKLYFQTRTLRYDLPRDLPGNVPDNTILATVLALQTRLPDRAVVLVSKDINLRIKAAALGIQAEDYRNDKVLDDLSLLATGQARLAEGFWERSGKRLKSWQDNGRTYYTLSGPDVDTWHPNMLVHDGRADGFEAIARRLDAGTATLELLDNYRKSHHSVWGINARNREQNFALNVLMDPDIDIVTLLGNAGTGKTLLTLAAGLAQVLDERRYQEIIMTRATVPMGEDIGFLPGTEEEKMAPWMGALMDNLEVLSNTDGGSWGRAATNDLLRNRIKIHAMNFMRGRTFLNKYVIIDEAQNLTSKQMKALITRAGPGTKMVVLGNVGQIDTPYLTETTSGLTYVVDRFKTWDHASHITLLSGERSRLADYASDIL
ncbi:MAG TPA: PhoH family protein [Gammaproteobacteria bacterium]|nr:PhoH family protein [Gammaproteobacteria bacterium]